MVNVMNSDMFRSVLRSSKCYVWFSSWTNCNWDRW